MDSNGVWAILIVIVLIFVLSRFLPEETRNGAGCGCLVVAVLILIGIVLIL